ncbi:ATP-grasp domain-containing protein [Paenibacillus tianjinensis]|uniref:ATP-grasp domain-containing protein n=1 Tax=Paenibacillus tianjinensis TaxID=2810347 RepID=A0ABX7L861_9BACL|nr:ATP-grasp domain-containing protein [Paenibacillus tianjinensis]QSF44363.1 ATP-grasp domain-containing protein [Paenibacillus tianjinensis]
MRVIFCRDPLDAKRVDMDYEAEWHGAQAAGFKTELLSLEDIELINDPSAYTHCHYLPYSYPLIASMTPRTIWRTSPGGPEDWTELFAQIAAFGQSALQPELTPFRDIARTITSRFFTMDIAKTAEGRWIIVELGDGGVSGLPVQMDVRAFYEKLMNANIG